MVGLIISLAGSISASPLNKVRYVLLSCRVMGEGNSGDVEGKEGLRVSVRVKRHRELSGQGLLQQRTTTEGRLFFEHISTQW